jgi:hypothetical protein
MTRIPAFVTAFTVLAATGVIHGLWTDRWTFSAEPEASAAKLADVPVSVGAWQAQPMNLDSGEQEKAAIVGYIKRLYVHSLTRSRVQVVLVCGRPGPISVHTPDICFEGAGNQMTNSERFSPASMPSDSFWLGDFVKMGREAQGSFRVFWSWNAEGNWQASDNPRWTFARSKALFKLYVIRDLAQAGEPLRNDPCVEFLSVFLPELKKCLFDGTRGSKET